MAFDIISFDDLLLTPYLRSGDSQDIGTGHALSNFLQLPGGGWLDAYGARKSPQGIRPLTKSGLIVGTNATDVRHQLDAIRGKLGKRGRLVVRFDDGAVRWQWARLIDVSTPRSSSDVGPWLAIEMSWTTASQLWYGVVRGTGWTWGDGSWIFGDGTAEFGQGTILHALGAGAVQFVVDHLGSTEATNIRLLFTIVTNPITTLSVVNWDTGHLITWDGADLTNTQRLEIDVGAKTVYRLAKVTPAIDQVLRVGNVVDVTFVSAHGLSDGDLLYIEGTDNGLYDGYWPNLDVFSSTHVYLPVAGDDRAHVGISAATGTAYKATNEYSNCTFSDLGSWFGLAPGENTITINHTNPSATSTVSLFYVDQFA